MANQRRVTGGRKRVTACTERAIKAAVQREAKRFNVSASFVATVAIADALGIPLQFEDRYKQSPGALRLVKNGIPKHAISAVYRDLAAERRKMPWRKARA